MMARGVLVRVICHPGRELVLRCVLRAACALWFANQVQGSEGPVAKKQRADEQNGQLPGTEQFHRRSGPVSLDMGNAILPFGRGGCPSTLFKETLLLASCSVGPTDVLSAPVFGPCVGECVAAGAPFMMKMAVLAGQS